MLRRVAYLAVIVGVLLALTGCALSLFGYERRAAWRDVAEGTARVVVGARSALFLPFADLGLMLDSFVVENLSLPDELQKMLDTRVGMNMVGDMGRYTQFQVANSMPIAAANEGGGGVAGIGVGLAGVAGRILA